MNAESPPFKHGDHNSESMSTIDRDITPLSQFMHKLGFLIRCLVLFEPKRWKAYGNSDGQET